MIIVDKFDRTIFFTVLAGVLLGTAVGVALFLWALPEAATQRPAVLSTMVIPLGCLVGWLLSPSREQVVTAALVCFGLYFLSAFAAARLGTFFPDWNYFNAILWVQATAGLILALVLAFSGRVLPQIEQLRRVRDQAGLAAFLREGSPRERLEAARALGALLEAGKHQPLLEALRDQEPHVRREAAAALIGLATAEDVPRLEAALQDGDSAVRRHALETLRWVEGGAAKEALASYWRSVLEIGPGQLWRQASLLLAGGVLLIISPFLPWGEVTGPAYQPLWSLSGGNTVALLLIMTALLPVVELFWGLARRNLTGHLERLRIWILLPAVILALALLWPLRGPAVLEIQGWVALGVGFWVALMGATLELVGPFFIRG